VIAADPLLCSGCGRCEAACSLERTGCWSHAGSAIRLVRAEILGFDFPVTCRACGSCADACPTGALELTSGGLVQVDEEACERCGACRLACPVGVLEGEDLPFFCSDCGRCADACNLGALRRVDPEPGEKLPAPGETEELTPPLRRLFWALGFADLLPWISTDDARNYRQSFEG
jgi:Fe-S-cluster-containing hydrogenase component 2